MNTLKVVAIVPILVLLAACGSSQDESFAFDQETLSVIDNKLHEFEGVEKQAQGEAIHPVLVANLLDGGIAYDDTRPADVRDSTCRERFIPSKLSGQGSRQTDIYRITFSYDSRAVNHILLIHRGEMTFINMHEPYEKVVKAVLKFFDRNKNVDPRLMPLFVQRITRWYLGNHWSDERGEWFDWFNERDSVSREYYRFQYPEE